MNIAFIRAGGTSLSRRSGAYFARTNRKRRRYYTAGSAGVERRRRAAVSQICNLLSVSGGPCGRTVAIIYTRVFPVSVLVKYDEIGARTRTGIKISRLTGVLWQIERRRNKKRNRKVLESLEYVGKWNGEFLIHPTVMYNREKILVLFKTFRVYE